MNKIVPAFLLLLAALFLLPAQAQSDWCITNVTIIDVTGNETPGPKDVYIKNGRIYKISDVYEKPRAADKIIDGSGKFLMAGLADMHVHLPAKNTERFLLMNLAAGVTSVRSMRGDTVHLSLRKKAEAGQIISPRLFLSAPIFSPRDSIKSEDLERVVKEYKKQGFDLLKILWADSLRYEQIMVAAGKAKMMVAGHTPNKVSMQRVVESGYSCVEHLMGLINLYQQDSAALPPVINKIKEKGMYNCGTIDWYNVAMTMPPIEELEKRDGLEYISKAEIEKWTKSINDYHEAQAKRDKDSVAREVVKNQEYIDDKLRVLKILSDNGCLLLLSPDATGDFSVPGFSMYEEMRLYRKAGLPNNEVLKAATYNAAKYFRQEKEWGSVQEGLRADLILLDKNPLENIENIKYQQGVFLNGSYYSSAELKQKLEN